MTSGFVTFPRTATGGAMSRMADLLGQALPAVALFVAIVVGRVVFVSLYAESIPFWDQWDAEGAGLVKPWLEGSLHWGDLLAPHNEHRILLSRLISLGLFAANHGQWDNLVSAYANTGLYAAASTLLYLLLRPEFASRAARATLALALLALAWIPYAYENTLVGFQNQFHLMTGLAVATVACAAKGAESPRLVPAVVFFAVLGYFTMASGLLGGVAAAGVLLLRWWTGRLKASHAALGIVLLAVGTVLAYAAVPRLPYHETLKATDLTSWLRATLTVLSWPTGYGYRSAWILWLPTVVAIGRFVRTRRATPGELLVFGLAAWVLLQAMAIGYSRGNGISWPPSRYMDTLAVGLVVNLWFALRLVAVAWEASPEIRSPRVVGSILMLAVLVTVQASALAMHIPTDLAAANARRADSIEQTANVRRYVATGDRGALRQPGLAIPYPDAGRLASLLDDGTIRGALPASIRAPLRGVLVDTVTPGFRLEHPDGFSPQLSSCRPADCVSSRGRLLTGPLATTAPYLELQAEVRGASRDLAVKTLSLDGTGLSEMQGPSLSAGKSQRLYVRTGGDRFRLLMRDDSPRGALIVRDAVEVGTLSMLSAQLQDRIRDAVGSETGLERSSRVAMDSPLADAASNVPLALRNGAVARVTWRAPASGQVERIAVQIGNYGGTSDGDLVVTACAQAGCVSQRGSLKGSRDNAFFELALPRPWRLTFGEQLNMEITNNGSTQPVALWTYPASKGSAVVASTSVPDTGSLSGRGLRLQLTYRRP